MLSLLLTIILTSWLLVSFRVFAQMRVDNLPVIIINYWVCVLTGIFYPGNAQALVHLQASDSTWVGMALLTGACFLPTFFLMSYTVKNVSVTVATLASKTSLVVPVVVSLLYLRPENAVAPLMWLGLVLGFAAIILSSIRSEEATTQVSWRTYVLPGAVFAGGALVDVLVNISNARFIPATGQAVFPLLAFSASAFTGTVVMLGLWYKRRVRLTARTWLAGIMLGIPNFLSILFLLKTLHEFNNNGAVVFPVLNISVILLNTLVGIFVFKEKAGFYTGFALVLSLASLILVLQHG